MCKYLFEQSAAIDVDGEKVLVTFSVAPMMFSVKNRQGFFPIYATSSEDSDIYIVATYYLLLDGTITLHSWNGYYSESLESELLQEMSSINDRISLFDLLQKEYFIGQIPVQKEALDYEF